MTVMASQIIDATIVCLSVSSGTDQGKHQGSTSMAFVRGIHQWPVNHKGTVTRNLFPFDDVIIQATEQWAIINSFYWQFLFYWKFIRDLMIPWSRQPYFLDLIPTNTITPWKIIQLIWRWTNRVCKCGRPFRTASEIGRSLHLVAVTWKYKKPCYLTIWWSLMCAYVTDRLFIVV